MPRAGLTRARVVAEAAIAADESGPDAVTLAEVAKRVGVRLPSLYNHVPGADGLRRELTLLGLAELTARISRAAMGRSGQAALFEMASAYRAFALERPGLYATTVRAPDAGDAELVAASDGALSVVLAVLAGYGLSGPSAVDATRALRALLHGWVTLETSGGFGLPQDVEASFRRTVAGFDAALRSPGRSGRSGR